jgi:hypothetical protein
MDTNRRTPVPGAESQNQEVVGENYTRIEAEDDDFEMADPIPGWEPVFGNGPPLWQQCLRNNIALLLFEPK